MSVWFKDPVHSVQLTLSAMVIKIDTLILYREKIAVCSEIHVKHISAMWEENEISECWS